MVFIAHTAMQEPQSGDGASKPRLQAHDSNEEKLLFPMFPCGSSRGVERKESAWRSAVKYSKLERACCCFLIPCGRFRRAEGGDCNCWGGEPALCEEADLPAPALPRAFSRLRKEHGWAKGEAFKEGISNGSACKPAPFPALVPMSLLQHTGPHPFPRDAGGKLFCQCIFIFVSFGRQFIGLSAQVGISEPMFNASESTRLCTPSSSFLSLFSSLPNILTLIEVKVIPGQVRG